MRQLNITRHIRSEENAALNKYLSEVKREEMITAEEEKNLAHRIKEGDEKAVEKLVKANLRFVVSVAKQYQNRGVPLADLISEGNIGLIIAAKRFDETRGFKLISYAVWWIRQTIQKCIDDHSRLVRLPSNQSVMMNKVRKASMQMEQEFHREPTPVELGNKICLPADVIENIMRTATRQVSIDSLLTGSENLTLMDVIENDDSKNSERKLFDASLKIELEGILVTLPAIEADVLRLYFGLGGTKPLTLDEICISTGHTRAQVIGLKEKALLRLKQNSRCRVLKEYLG